MATENEQAISAIERLEAEIARLKDQLEAVIKRMVADLEEQTRLTEQAQAEIERLAGELGIVRTLKDQAEMYLVDNRRELQQAQARVKVLEETLKEILGHIPNKRYVRTQTVIKRIAEAALAEGDEP